MRGVLRHEEVVGREHDALVRPSARQGEHLQVSRVRFLSSRRRHTRFDCDWSSDVCSSDLTRVDITATGAESLSGLATPDRHISVVGLVNANGGAQLKPGIVLTVGTATYSVPKDGEIGRASCRERV